MGNEGGWKVGRRRTAVEKNKPKQGKCWIKMQLLALQKVSIKEGQGCMEGVN